MIELLDEQTRPCFAFNFLTEKSHSIRWTGSDYFGHVTWSEQCFIAQSDYTGVFWRKCLFTSGCAFFPSGRWAGRKLFLTHPNDTECLFFFLSFLKKDNEVCQCTTQPAWHFFGGERGGGGGGSCCYLTKLKTRLAIRHIIGPLACRVNFAFMISFVSFYKSSDVWL